MPTPPSVKQFLQFLADEKILSKARPNMFRVEKTNDELITVFFGTEKYRIVLLEIILPPKRSAQERINRNVPTVEQYKFTSPSNLYTPFLYPILGLDKKAQSISPVFSYGLEIRKMKTILQRARYLLKKGEIPENRLPQFLALSSSDIFINEPTFKDVYMTRLPIHGQARFTTIQVLKYLKQTDDVDEIISLWTRGVMPDEYTTYKESFALAPEEWLVDLFSENIKDYWPESISNLPAYPTTWRKKK